MDAVERIFDERGIKPIVAVIADNQDRDLRLSDPDTEFWDRVRLWQRKGWSIAHMASGTNSTQ